MSVVLTVISKTWGFNIKSKAMKISQIAELTGFTNRAIQKATSALVEKRIIVTESKKSTNPGSPLNEYLFNKHYDTWKIKDRKRVNHSSKGEPEFRLRVNQSSPPSFKETYYRNYIPQPQNLPESSPKNGTPPHLNGEEQSEVYLTKKKRKLSGKRLETFERFWTAFNYKKDKANAADAWLDIPQLTHALVDTICDAAEKEALSRPGKIAKGMIPIYAQGWISARRWEDEPETSQPSMPQITTKTPEERIKEMLS
jgi:phage replication O-like protein O